MHVTLPTPGRGKAKFQIINSSKRLHLPNAPGWSTSLVLEDVQLKVEAFEYLQLPFNITEGSIGRLEIQVWTEPWSGNAQCPIPRVAVKVV